MRTITATLAILVLVSTASAQQVNSNAAGPAVFGGVPGDISVAVPGPVVSPAVTALDSVTIQITFGATYNEPSTPSIPAGSYEILALPSPPAGPITTLVGQPGVIPMPFPPSPGTPGSLETITWTGFNPQNQAIQVALQVRVFKTTGQEGAANPVMIVTLAADTVAPGSLQSLLATPGALAGDVQLHWTAAGDDNGSGQASRYEVRCSAMPIVTASDFLGAAPVTGTVPAPAAAGTPEQMVAHGVAGGALRFFAVGAFDEVNNLGALSTAFIFLPDEDGEEEVTVTKKPESFHCSAGAPAAASLLPLLLLLALLPLRTLQS